MIHEDNQGAIKMAAKVEGTKRSKHIDIRFHQVREVVRCKEIVLVYINTKNMKADMLTKNLGRVQFEYCRNQVLARHL